MIKVTPEALKKICDTVPLSRCIILAEIMNRKISEYNVSTWDEFHEFVGQVVHESGQFNYKTENMNYSAKRLAVIWPKEFSATKNPPYVPNAMAFKLEKKPIELANYKYGNKYGNRPGTNDGYDFRGGGYIGITFRSLWQLYASYKKMDVNKASEWVRTTDEGSMDSAFWFFYIYRDLRQLAIDDNDKAITLRINGGYINYADRIKYTDRARKFLN